MTSEGGGRPEGSKLRVAVATSFPADPADPFGGVQSVSVALVQALTRFDDLELHVVTQDPRLKSVERSSWNGVGIHRLPQLETRVLVNACRAGRRQIHGYLAELRPDVVHAHDVFGLMVQGLPLPRVFTVHGFIYEDTRVSSERFPVLRSLLWRRVETAGWADQPHIISISPYVREKLHGIARGVIHDIDNPVSETFFRIERRETPGTIYSGGSICARKNTLGLVRGFRRLLSRGAKAELRISGAEPEPAYSQAVREYVRAEGIGESVKFLGRTSYEAVLDELSRASVFALVSLEENSPMSIEEAMAAGVPIVTSNRCGMPYMVRDGQSGYLVDPEDPEDIASRFEDVLASAEQRVAMGARGREIARDRFHPAMVARRTREVYYRSARRRPPTP